MDSTTNFLFKKINSISAFNPKEKACDRKCDRGSIYIQSVT